MFYVALTRARKTVTILAPQDKCSPFVRELVENAEYGVVELGASQMSIHHICSACGGRLIPERSSRERLRFVCEHKFHCGTVRPACPTCGNDLPKRSSEEPNVFLCSCGSRFQACPECTDGWLVERKGRFGQFLGCVNYPRCRGRDSSRDDGLKWHHAKAEEAEQRPHRTARTQIFVLSYVLEMFYNRSLLSITRL